MQACGSKTPKNSTPARLLVDGESEYVVTMLLKRAIAVGSYFEGIRKLKIDLP